MTIRKEITVRPYEERDRFQDLAIKWIEKDKETRSPIFERILGFLVSEHSDRTGGNWGSYKASFTLYIGYNFPRLEKYIDYLIERI